MFICEETSIIKLSNNIYINLALEKKIGNTVCLKKHAMTLRSIFSGFKQLNIFTISPILDVWRLQNSHLTLMNKKALALSVKLALHTSSCEMYSKSLCCWLWTDFTCCSDVSIADFEQVNATWVGWIVERNVFQSGTQVMLKMALDISC